MKWFSLKEVCRALVVDFQDMASPKSRIKLSIDIQLSDNLGGDTQPFLSIVTWLAHWLDSRLINGVIVIDIFRRSQFNDDVILVVQVTGLGTKSNDTRYLYTTACEFALSLPGEVRVKQEDDRLVFEFNVEWKTSESIGARTPVLFKKSILIAEDSEINALVFAGFLEEWGCEIVVVGDGQEALNHASENNFDLILMDIHMPVMGGNDAIRAIRKINKEIPIIVLTASTLESDIKESVDSGANDYLLKPVASKTLLSVLQKYLTSGRDVTPMIS